MEILKAYASMAVANSTSIGGDDTIFRVKLRRTLLGKNQHIDVLLEEYVGTSHANS